MVIPSTVSYAAGVLPITWHEGQPLFLVGKDTRDDYGGYSDFGGKGERVDRGCALATACREMEEESLGLLCSARTLRQRVQPHNSLLLASKTAHNHDYYCFLVQVPFMPHLRIYFAKAVDFLRNKGLARTLVEKTDVRWVTWDALMSPEFPKRAVFAKTLEKHRALLERVVSDPAAWTTICVEHAWQQQYDAD